jgi:hypothetical protein
MHRALTTRISGLAATVSVALALNWLAGSAAAGLIVNGGFDAGLSDWAAVDQIGSDGTFFLQSGTVSPSASDIVPAPPTGMTAAMSDAQGPGAHVLYQDFVVPPAPGPAELRFDLFVGNRAEAFFVPDPASLDFSTPALNQQARVDILLAGTDPFSVSAADVLLNVYQTNSGDPLVSGYTTVVANLTSLFALHPGETLRLRFAEVDNVLTFQLGVDNVDILAVPEPSTCVLASLAFVVLMTMRRRK